MTLQLTGKSQAELIAMIEAMSKAQQRSVTLKVSKKGGVSLYGLGRYPVTQYPSGWAKIVELAKSGELEAFIERNRALLSTGKDDPRFANLANDDAR